MEEKGAPIYISSRCPKKPRFVSKTVTGELAQSVNEGARIDRSINNNTQIEYILWLNRWVDEIIPSQIRSPSAPVFIEWSLTTTSKNMWN
jgi:hypothetical protein